MAAHCRYCDSTNLEQRTSKGVTYWYCLDCNRPMLTPIYDPAVAPVNGSVEELEQAMKDEGVDNVA